MGTQEGKLRYTSVIEVDLSVFLHFVTEEGSISCSINLILIHCFVEHFFNALWIQANFEGRKGSVFFRYT